MGTHRQNERPAGSHRARVVDGRNRAAKPGRVRRMAGPGQPGRSGPPPLCPGLIQRTPGTVPGVLALLFPVLQTGDLLQHLPEFIPPKHGRKGHEKAQADGGGHHVPDNGDGQDPAHGEKRQQGHGHGHDKGQQVGGHLVPGQFLDHLHNDVGDHHKDQHRQQDGRKNGGNVLQNGFHGYVLPK